MSKVFFKDLNLLNPKNNFQIKSKSSIDQISKIMIETEKLFSKTKPDWIFVFGDVNSTLATSLVARKLDLKIFHIESGLRSFDLQMPEEVNRILVDRISDLRFVTEISGKKNLIKEGFNPQKNILVGNTMIDSLYKIKDQIRTKKYISELKLDEKKYVVVTLHRPSNVDDIDKLQSLINRITFWNKNFKIIWPLHPRNNIKK